MIRGGGMVVLLLVGCGAEEAALVSVGSSLDPPRQWDGETQPDGSAHLVDVLPGEALSSDVLSLTWMITAQETTQLSVRVEDGEGRLWVDELRPEFSLNRVLRGRGLLVGALPVATAARPLASAYQLGPVRLQATAVPDPLEVTLWIKRRAAGQPIPEDGAAPAVQELEISVFLAGHQQADDHLMAALGELQRVWRQAGVAITLQEIRRLALPEGEATLIIDVQRGADTPALGQLLQRSAESALDSLCLFVMDNVGVTSGAPIWAITGGIPVPPRHGTIRSGLAVNGALISQDPQRAGRILAHEVGHALGLFHTSEGSFALDGSGPTAVPIHDPIDDTVACPAEADRNGDQMLDPGECAAYDAGNLMFWAPVPDGTTLTRQQGEIVRRSALVR